MAKHICYDIEKIKAMEHVAEQNDRAVYFYGSAAPAPVLGGNSMQKITAGDRVIYRGEECDAIDVDGGHVLVRGLGFTRWVRQTFLTKKAIKIQALHDPNDLDAALDRLGIAGKSINASRLR